MKVIKLFIVFILLISGTYVAPYSVISKEASVTTYWTDDGIVGDGFAGGTGTKEDPFIIETAPQLAYLAKTVNDGVSSYEGQYIKVAQPIDLQGHLWLSIGRKTNLFRGSFNGGFNAIINMRQNEDGGLFGYLKHNVMNPEIKISFVVLENVDISLNTSSESTAGGIAHSVENITIEHSSVSGIISTKNYSGGIVGWAWNSMFSGCKFSGYVSGSAAGGIVGKAWSSDFLGSIVNATVKGTVCAGGVLGCYYSSSDTTTKHTFLSNWVKGTIIGQKQCGALQFIGGLAGHLGNSQNDIIKLELNTIACNILGSDQISLFFPKSYLNTVYKNTDDRYKNTYSGTKVTNYKNEQGTYSFTLKLGGDIFSNYFIYAESRISVALFDENNIMTGISMLTPTDGVTSEIDFHIPSSRPASKLCIMYFNASTLKPGLLTPITYDVADF